MATIRASCDHCGDVELTTGHVTAWTRPSDEDSYSFVCPLCAELNVRGTDRRTLNLLIASGVQCVELGLPISRAAHPAAASSCGPLGSDDVDAFCALLDDDHAFAEALGGLLTS